MLLYSIVLRMFGSPPRDRLTKVVKRCFVVVVDCK